MTMKSMKLKLFEFRKTLTTEQTDVDLIISEHINLCDNYSELEILENLKNQLEPYMYFSDLKPFLENVENELNEDSVVYALKDLYHKIKRKGDTFLYTQALNTILECSGIDDDVERNEKILNDLKMYEWIPEVRGFLYDMAETPQAKQNFSSDGAKIEDVFSVAVQVEEGFLTYIDDKWFILTDDIISYTTLEKHITDQVELKKLRLLEQSINKGVIDENEISFKISEELNISFDFKTKEMKLNDSPAEKEMTLEVLFNSPIIPIGGKGFYPMLVETVNNLDKFTNIDVAKRVYNVIKPSFECYVFKYKNSIAQYRIDKRMGKNFYTFENAISLIEEVAHELGADLTYFYEDRLNDEVGKIKLLESDEKRIDEKINEIDDALFTIKLEDKKIVESKEVKSLINTLLVQKHNLTIKLNNIKNKKSELLK